VDGRAQMMTEKRKDGTEYETYKRDFIGRPLCLGNLETLLSNSIDPDNCPACMEAQSTDTVGPPERRFAMHIIRYATKPNGFEVQSPFSVGVFMWSFSDKTFNILTDIAVEFNLKQHDLLLGPCENKDFQKFDIKAASSAAWLQSDSTKQLTVATYRENKAKSNLEEFCGRKVDHTWIEEDLNKIKIRWQIANGEVLPVGRESSSPLAEGLDDILSGVSSKGDTNGAVDSVTVDDIFNAITSEKSIVAESVSQGVGVEDGFSTATVNLKEADSIAATASTVDAADTEKVAVKEEEKGEVFDFDSLLNSFE
jgi:hypothetical protein